MLAVQGTEKVILIQEQLSKNRIIIEKDYKGPSWAPSRLTEFHSTLLDSLRCTCCYAHRTVLTVRL